MIGLFYNILIQFYDTLGLIKTDKYKFSLMDGWTYFSITPHPYIGYTSTSQASPVMTRIMVVNILKNPQILLLEECSTPSTRFKQILSPQILI